MTQEKYLKILADLKVDIQDGHLIKILTERADDFPRLINALYALKQATELGTIWCPNAFLKTAIKYGWKPSHPRYKLEVTAKM